MSTWPRRWGTAGAAAGQAPPVPPCGCHEEYPCFSLLIHAAVCGAALFAGATASVALHPLWFRWGKEEIVGRRHEGREGPPRTSMFRCGGVVGAVLPRRGAAALPAAGTALGALRRGRWPCREPHVRAASSRAPGPLALRRGVGSSQPRETGLWPSLG